MRGSDVTCVIATFHFFEEMVKKMAFNTKQENIQENGRHFDVACIQLIAQIPRSNKFSNLKKLEFRLTLQTLVRKLNS